MAITSEIAKQLRDVYLGNNWTAVNLKDTLEGVDWEAATAQVYHFNTIAALVFHIDYFVGAVLKVLEGGPLDAHDNFSFDVGAITCDAEWQALKEKVMANAEMCATQIAQLDDSILLGDFADAKYGSYYRNLQGIIEHAHYHLGQITLIKKMLDCSIK